MLDRYGILFIADEVQSGFGRTGKMFAIEHYGVDPDIIVMAKGIADGFPLSATVARPEIADSLRPGEHLSTFGGNPVSCAAAVANIDVFREERLAEAAAQKGEQALARLKELASPARADWRCARDWPHAGCRAGDKPPDESPGQGGKRLKCAGCAARRACSSASVGRAAT
ncbi:MAG: hypothetical protein KatS3mg059_1516 [Thermomicrobiales bacterium]|nr:MAG: hypothetical protein KatS3mg059_1516 [Thermomicrobiales bacterium]